MKVGDHLKVLFKDWLRIEQWTGCGCQAMIDRMNKWGPAGCRVPKNLNRIVNKMRSTAKKAPKWRVRILGYLPGVKRPMRAMVHIAIQRAEAEERAVK